MRRSICYDNVCLSVRYTRESRLNALIYRKILSFIFSDKLWLIIGQLLDKLGDLELRNSPNLSVISPNSVTFGTDYVKVVEDTPILSAPEI